MPPSIFDPNTGITRSRTPVTGTVNFPQLTTGVQATPISSVATGAGTSFINQGTFRGVNFGPPVFLPPIVPPSGPPPPQSPATPPSGSPTDLQLLLASLAYVQDGQVIMSQQFNTIIDILRGLANLAGAGLTPTGLTTTVAPIFPGTFDANSTAWTVVQGYAVVQQSGTQTAPAQAVSASGWLVAPLPNGAQISNMVVIGQRTGYPANTNGVKFEVQLIRQLLTDPTNSENTTATLITSELAGSDGQFTSQPVSVQAPTLLGIDAQGSASVALQLELQTVDTTKYRYLIVARASSPQTSSTTTAQISAIQITFTVPLS